MNLKYYREGIVEQYRDKDNSTFCSGDFGEILCHEIHTGGLTFLWLAEKWNMSVTMLGLLIADHCARLEVYPKVNFDYKRD